MNYFFKWPKGLSNLFIHKKKFLPLYTKIVDDMAGGHLLTPENNRYSPQTARNYKSGMVSLKWWEQENGIIYLEDITQEWSEQFIIFMMEKGYTKNTIAITLTRIKAVLNRLYNKGISRYNGHGIVVHHERVTTVYSSMEDIKCLLEYDCYDTPGLERVRDIYILQCFIGLRYRDLASVLDNPKRYIRNIGGWLFFEIKTQKTGEVVVIPLARVVKQLLDKYEYDFGTPFSYQYYNLTIKSLAAKAGINQDILFTRTEGGKRVDRSRPKCELMSNHTARRTFATNAFLSGMPEKNIMLITGHKTSSAFQRYIQCSTMEAAIKIADHDFFAIDLPVTKNLHGGLPPHTERNNYCLQGLLKP